MSPIFEPLQNVDEERGLGDFSVNFADFGPTAYENAGQLFSFNATAAALARGITLGYTNPVNQVFHGFFSDSATIAKEGTGQILSPEQANEMYGIQSDGRTELNFTKPIGSAEAQLLHDDKLAQMQRRKQLAAVKGFGPNLVIMGIDVLREINDPVGLASMFFPAFKGHSFAKGFAEGAIGAAISITPGTIIGHKYQRDFQTQQAITTVLFGGLFSGGVSSALGKINKTLTKISDRAEQVRVQTFKDFIEKEVKVDQPEADPEALELAASELLNEGETPVAAAVAQFHSLQQVEQHRRGLYEQIQKLLDLRKNLVKMQDGPKKESLQDKFNLRIQEFRDELDGLPAKEKEILDRGYGNKEKQDSDRKKKMHKTSETDEIAVAEQAVVRAEDEFIKADLDATGTETTPALARLEEAKAHLAALKEKQPKKTRIEHQINTGTVEGGDFDPAAIAEKNRQRQQDLDRLEDQIELAMGGNKKSQFLIRQVLERLFPRMKQYFIEGDIDDILEVVFRFKESGGFKIDEVEVRTQIDEGPSGITEEIKTRVLSATDRKNDLGDMFSGKASIFERMSRPKTVDEVTTSTLDRLKERETEQIIEGSPKHRQMLAEKMAKMEETQEKLTE
ncbi:MAG TPA: hypothetical protein EYQ21_07300, partial [Flavobacteriales bacterium]|nr:hypothetical protein [Flavobacteriales bacterium]